MIAARPKWLGAVSLVSGVGAGDAASTQKVSLCKYHFVDRRHVHFIRPVTTVTTYVRMLSTLNSVLYAVILRTVAESLFSSPLFRG